MAHITVQFELTEEQKQKLELFNAQMSMFYDRAREDDFSEKVEQDLGMIDEILNPALEVKEAA